MSTVYDTPYDAYRPTATYRLFGVDGSLVYVGVGDNPYARIEAHRKKWWGDEIARIDITWFETRLDALIEEAKAIDTESPKRNQSVGSGRIAFAVIRDRHGPVRPVLSIKLNDRGKRLEGVEHGDHLMVYGDGIPGLVAVPYNWYAAASERLGDPVDPESLQAHSGS